MPRSRLSIRYVLWSAALLAPCFWLPRIYAGDLGSHLYNAWLYQLVMTGQADGLAIRPQFTNILFDRLLGWLFAALGPSAAERLAVSAAVLVFGWGAFAFISAASGGRPWRIMPAVLMLSYGYVFAMGFLNFYLSMGVCFWILALLWKPTPVRAALSLPLVLVAAMAHSLPLAWCAGALAYVHLAARLKPRARLLLLAACIAGVLLVRALASSRFPSLASPTQALLATGADQLWVFGPVFLALAWALVAVWLLPLLRIFQDGLLSNLAGRPPAQLALLTGAAVALVPTAILLPGYNTALAFISDRMSLPGAVCLAALAASTPWRRFETAALAALALLFFAFLYVDQRAMDRLENRMVEAVAKLPPRSRVASALGDTRSRTNALTHLIDRACIGRCFSYGNYEPSTAQFRLHALRPNPVVAFRPPDSFALQEGGYVVQPQDQPFYEIVAHGDGRDLTTSLVAPGQKTRPMPVRVLPF